MCLTNMFHRRPVIYFRHAAPATYKNNIMGTSYIRWMGHCQTLKNFTFILRQNALSQLVTAIFMDMGLYLFLHCIFLEFIYKKIYL